VAGGGGSPRGTGRRRKEIKSFAPKGRGMIPRRWEDDVAEHSVEQRDWRVPKRNRRLGTERVQLYYLFSVILGGESGPKGGDHAGLKKGGISEGERWWVLLFLEIRINDREGTRLRRGDCSLGVLYEGLL